MACLHDLTVQNTHFVIESSSVVQPVSFLLLKTFSMADLVVLVWTSVLLTSACCLTQKQEELAAKVPGQSVTTLKKDPRKMELTWDNSDNITMPTDVMKTHNSPVLDKNYIRKICCGFSNCNLRYEAMFLDSLTMYQNTSKKELIFNDTGDDTAAKNFSCHVYNVEFMNCTWTVGRAAPNDVQYYLYSQNAKRQQERECPSYIKDSQKRHVGCHFDKVDGFRGKGYFLVTGTSKRREISNLCSGTISLLSIEIWVAPSNITVNCSKSNCLIRWLKPKTKLRIGDAEFKYQLFIQKQDLQYTHNDEVNIPGSPKNEYDFQNYDMEIKHILKIRASRRDGNWGEWSEPIEFGGYEKPKSSPTYVYIYILVIFATAVLVLIIMFIFKRYFVMQRLFPQIPQIKDKVNTCDHLDKQIIWEEFKHPEKCEEIMTIDVIG
ncbi:granulocyte-macrophage colony-stimulating factor receptor subunit alpha-like [Trichosurus vulpecula]|uniref:granulocyte-macrophage colony-stimulating factor receptor subunit alpha-like n=1 Tax=Trichosurus vulpecula TaxID=9337 RepID=UPI00186B2EA2|nr:granulocyte-macrophage colony-stimulating factor receptor subunit alpha-like [Trichosurus vulpecula]